MDGPQSFFNSVAGGARHPLFTHPPRTQVAYNTSLLQQRGMLMNARELVALGLPQECVAVAYDSLKASGLISQPADAAHRIGEILAKPENFAADAHFRAL